MRYYYTIGNRRQAPLPGVYGASCTFGRHERKEGVTSNDYLTLIRVKDTYTEMTTRFHREGGDEGISHTLRKIEDILEGVKGVLLWGDDPSRISWDDAMRRIASAADEISESAYEEMALQHADELS